MASFDSTTARALELKLVGSRSPSNSILSTTFHGAVRTTEAPTKERRKGKTHLLSRQLQSPSELSSLLRQLFPFLLQVSEVPIVDPVDEELEKNEVCGHSVRTRNESKEKGGQLKGRMRGGGGGGESGSSKEGSWFFPLSRSKSS